MIIFLLSLSFYRFRFFVFCLHYFYDLFDVKVLHRIGGYEPERGVGVAGHRAYFLRDAGLLLNQALINYSIAFLRKR